MISAQCDFIIPEQKGLEDGLLTVGRTTVLNCSTDTELTGIDLKQYKIKNVDENHYWAKILNSEITDVKAFKLDIAIYKTGAVNFSDLSLSDGSNEITLASQKPLEVKSVIQSSTEKPPESFGPILPIKVDFPLIYFIGIIVIVLSVAASIAFKIKKTVYYRDLQKKLKDYQSPTDPDVQFFKSIRSAEKINYPLERIESAFKVYMLRAYQVPIFDIPKNEIAKYFKYVFKTKEKACVDYLKCLNEIEILRKRSDAVPLEEKQILIKKLYRFVDDFKGMVKDE